MDVLRIRVGIYYYYYYYYHHHKAEDVILGRAAFAKYPLSRGVRLAAVQTFVVACRSGELGRTCCHGGWPGPSRLPMPLRHRTTTDATTTTAGTTGTTAAVSIVSFTRARAYYNTRRLYTTLGRRHLCGPAPPLAKCILCKSRLSIAMIILYYKSPPWHAIYRNRRYNMIIVPLSFPRRDSTGRPQRQPSDRNNIILLSRQTIHTTTNTTTYRINASATNEVNPGL